MLVATARRANCSRGLNGIGQLFMLEIRYKANEKPSVPVSRESVESVKHTETSRWQSKQCGRSAGRPAQSSDSSVW